MNNGEKNWKEKKTERNPWREMTFCFGGASDRKAEALFKTVYWVGIPPFIFHAIVQTLFKRIFN